MQGTKRFRGRIARHWAWAFGLTALLGSGACGDDTGPREQEAGLPDGGRDAVTGDRVSDEADATRDGTGDAGGCVSQPWRVPPHDTTKAAPPLLYVMNDYGNCDPKTFTDKWGQTCFGLAPEQVPSENYPFGSFGSHVRPLWNQIEHGPGQYDWTRIDEALDRACSQTVYLPDGTEAPKPILLTVAIYSLRCGQNEYFCDHSPDYLPHPVIEDANGNCPPAHIPAYTDPVWQEAYFNFLRALGDRYDGHPCLGALLLASGIDDETSPTRAWNVGGQNCDYRSSFADWPGYLDFVKESLHVAAEAFPNTAVYVQNLACTTEHGCRDGITREAELAGVGVKLNGATAPGIGYCWYHSMAGWGMMEILDREFELGLIPTGLEPKTAGGDDVAFTYWMLMGGLAHHVDVFDVQKGHFLVLEELPDAAGFRQFFAAYVHRTAADAPGVWAVLRGHTDLSAQFDYSRCPVEPPDPDYVGCYPNDVVESQYPDCWASDAYGDLQYFLARVTGPDGRTRVVEPDELPEPGRFHPYAAYQVRATDEASGSTRLYFHVEDSWWAKENPCFRVTIAFLDRGTDSLSVVYTRADGTEAKYTIQKTGTDDFRTESFLIEDMALRAGFLDGRADFALDSEGDGDEYVHFVGLEANWAQGR